MPSEEKINSALAISKASGTISGEVKEVLEYLAESYLGRKGVEKKDVRPEITVWFEPKEDCLGWNACCDAQRLASIVSEEEIFEIAKQATVSFTMAREHDNFSYERHLAHAIAEFVNGRREKCIEK
jgi:hypothetical protein